jgi:hypothetical protein
MIDRCSTRSLDSVAVIVSAADRNALRFCVAVGRRAARGNARLPASASGEKNNSENAEPDRYLLPRAHVS